MGDGDVGSCPGPCPQPTSPAATLTRCRLLSATRDSDAVLPLLGAFLGV